MASAREISNLCWKWLRGTKPALIEPTFPGIPVNISQEVKGNVNGTSVIISSHNCWMYILFIYVHNIKYDTLLLATTTTACSLSLSYTYRPNLLKKRWCPHLMFPLFIYFFLSLSWKCCHHIYREALFTFFFLPEMSDETYLSLVAGAIHKRSSSCV